MMSMFIEGLSLIWSLTLDQKRAYQILVQKVSERAQIVVNGELNCTGDVCVINCMAGFVVDGGSPQAKCIKGMVHQSPSSRCTTWSVFGLFARNELFGLFAVRTVR